MSTVTGWKLFTLVDGDLKGGHEPWAYKQKMAGFHRHPQSSLASIWSITTPIVTPETSHLSPGDDCRCGINAWRDRPDVSTIMQWSKFPNPTVPIVLAEVELWGKVIEHDGGYRAQFAEMVRKPRLLMPPVKDAEKHGSEAADALSDRYDLEFICETFPWPYTIGDNEHGDREAQVQTVDPGTTAASPLGGAPEGAKPREDRGPGAALTSQTTRGSLTSKAYREAIKELEKQIFTDPLGQFTSSKGLMDEMADLETTVPHKTWRERTVGESKRLIALGFVAIVVGYSAFGWWLA